MRKIEEMIEEEVKREREVKVLPKAKRLLLAVIVSILLIILAWFLPLKPIGFVTKVDEFNYTDSVNLKINDSYEHIWIISNYGMLKSVRLDGSISKEGVAEVYLEYRGEDYLIFDSSRLGGEDIGKVTGLVVGNESIINKSIDSNATSALELNKSITLRVLGGGRKTIHDIFEFNVGVEFNWDVDYNKICTKWDVNDVSVCYGSAECCVFIELESLGDWNDSFYLSYGRYGSGLDNIVRAQVIYANYSLDVENPYVDIVYSNVIERKADFYEARISFEDVCVETCLLHRFNATSYKLRFIVEEGSLVIDNIRYSVEKEVNISANAPLLVKDIENITVYKNEEYIIDLHEYFVDEDGDGLSYSAYGIDNISIKINDSIVRIIPDYNFTGRRYMYFRASDGYYEAISNLFSVRVIEKPFRIYEVNISEVLIKPFVVINSPVRWVKVVNASAGVINLSVNISNDALNVSVRDVREDRIISEDKIKIIDRNIVKNYSAYRMEKRIEQIKEIEEMLTRKKERIIDEDPTNKEVISQINEELIDLNNEKNKLTGYIVAVEKGGFLKGLFERLFENKITSYVVLGDVNNSLNVTSVIIEDIVEDVEVVYYTEGPYSEEENISRGKRIVVSSDIHYENILAYTYLDDVQKSKIRLYHVTDGSRELVSEVGYYDENNNNLIDKIEWIIPSLSNETYEVVIEISKAEHLDENRSFIEDIYGYVMALDNNWSEAIPVGHYLRVTFERELDNTRDITIYARPADNNSAEIEVYTQDSDVLVTRFENISSEDWYKVYLNNLNGSYKVFDLRVLGSVEIDYIVDPIPAPSANKFVITNSSGDNVASIDDKGDMYIKGTVAENQESLGPTSNSFIVQNSSGDIVSYINSSGYLFLLSVYVNSSNLIYAGTKLEFRNASNDLVAFFASNGSLMLWGNLTQNYADP